MLGVWTVLVVTKFLREFIVIDMRLGIESTVKQVTLAIEIILWLPLPSERPGWSPCLGQIWEPVTSVLASQPPGPESIDFGRGCQVYAAMRAGVFNTDAAPHQDWSKGCITLFWAPQTHPKCTRMGPIRGITVTGEIHGFGWFWSKIRVRGYENGR